MKKIFLIIFLVIAIIIFFQQKNTEVTTFKKDQSGQILVAQTPISFNQLTEKEKDLIKKAYPDAEYFIKEYDSDYYLKYYDNKVVLIGSMAPKPTSPIVLFDLGKNLISRTGELNLWGGYYESKNIIITVFDRVITYFRPGFVEIKKVRNSELIAGETYVKMGGMANEYKLSFDESTQTLTVSVFKDEQKEGQENQKLREVQFVLE